MSFSVAGLPRAFAYEGAWVANHDSMRDHDTLTVGDLLILSLNVLTEPLPYNYLLDGKILDLDPICHEIENLSVY